MTTLLEQAIIDAKELRAAALKNAETTILEKYNREVKNMVESLLDEQDEELDLGMDSMDSMDSTDSTDSMDSMVPEVTDDLPFSSAGGEKLCPCPEDEEVTMTLNLDDLIQMDDELGTPEEQMPEEELASSVLGEPEEELDSLQESIDDLDIDENDIRELVEKLIVDMGGKPSGYMNRSSSEIQYEADMENARLESETYRAEAKKLKKENINLTKTNTSLIDNNKLLKETIIALKEKLEKVNLSNAKLLYSNLALNSTSLNERQKQKVVDSIQKAGSVEETKIIYETLQSAVGDIRNRTPNSLSEAVSRKSSTIMPKRTENHSREENLLKDRFKELAGIKNRN